MTVSGQGAEKPDVNLEYDLKIQCYKFIFIRKTVSHAIASNIGRDTTNRSTLAAVISELWEVKDKYDKLYDALKKSY